MKKLFIYLLGTLLFTLLLGGTAAAQSGLEEWDENYPIIELNELLRYEQRYADSIEASLGKDEYYFRAAKYRFSATYKGLKRRLDPKVLQSMRNVLSYSVGSAAQLEGLVEHEYLFEVGETRFWAPLQRQLEEPFVEEVRNGDALTLYCLFLNEHSSNGLFNTFLVSEFLKE
ncbi:hypothetical protein [Pontibacter roseus]|uniref:hypothetical protein n=1 Tax=Pontibacter roseus TaxID=336989 RepID=UPI000362D769|nr:hypothetical protein [Pontibacter roseus]